MNQKRPLLRIDNLRVSYRTRRGALCAVDGVNLHVNEGETVALVGESGCGKTMTALSITRITLPSAVIEADSVTLEDNDLLNLSNDKLQKIRGKKISYVFQDPMTYLNPVMKIYDQIAEPIKMHTSLNNREINREVMQLLNDVQLADKEKVSQSYPHELSGGMKQRILMAIALSCKPSLLIADEPTTALDVTVQAAVLDLLMQLKNRYKLSALLITHDLGIVGEISDRVYIMYAGKIMESGTTFEIYDNPLHPYTAGLLNSVKSVINFKGDLYSIQGSVPDPLQPPLGCRFHPRCPDSMPVCSQKYPPLFEVEKGQTVSCWLYEVK